MIGQSRNIDTIIKWRLNKSIPRFIIIEGPEGSGRLTLSKLIMKQLGAQGIISGISKSEVNDIIQNAYTVTSTTCYIFRDADEMSTEAKNSLLKVVEEPPNKAYFIMTIRSKSNMLSTILSRGTLIQMQHYLPEELKTFTTDESILSLARTPGDCISFDSNQCIKTLELVDDVMQALQSKKGVEILRLTSQLKAKESETDKIDPELFFRAFLKSFMQWTPVNISCLTLVLDAAEKMNYKSLNKKALVESMLISMLKRLKNDKILEKME